MLCMNSSSKTGYVKVTKSELNVCAFPEDWFDKSHDLIGVCCDHYLSLTGRNFRHKTASIQLYSTELRKTTVPLVTEVLNRLKSVGHSGSHLLTQITP